MVSLIQGYVAPSGNARYLELVGCTFILFYIYIYIYIVTLIVTLNFFLNKFLICCLLIVSEEVVKFRCWVGLGMYINMYLITTNKWLIF